MTTLCQLIREPTLPCQSAFVCTSVNAVNPNTWDWQCCVSTARMFMVTRNTTNVMFVASYLAIPVAGTSTCVFTQERNLTSVALVARSSGFHRI